MLNPARRIRKALLFSSLWAAASWIVAGCSVGDFIGAYFNTYYNAQRQFSEAEDELLSQPDVKQKENAFGFAYNIQPATKTKFEAVIEKCSRLLQYHPESSLVDDALLMIGKSYYYENDYQPAERKFKELIEQFPKSSLAYEARLLLGYTYYMMNDKARSETAGKDLLDLADKEGEDGYFGRAAMLLAQIELDNQNIPEAKKYYQSAAEKSGSSEDRCSAFLNLAGLLTQEGNYQRALEAYRKAEKASSTYRSMYRARMGQARMLSRLGAYEESLSQLRDLLSSTNNKEFYGEIALEIANVFKASKDYPSAIAQYTYVDTSYARTEAAANSYFQLGDLYETRLAQYDSARVFYTKGRTEFAQALITAQLIHRSDYITRYIQIRNEIRRLDTVKTALLAPPDTSHLLAAARADSTVDSLKKKSDTTLAHTQSSPPGPQDSLQKRSEATAPRTQTVLAGPQDSLRKRSDSTMARTPVAPGMSLDSVNARLAFDATELATLFYTSMNVPDSAEKWYRQLLVEFPSSPQAPRALFTLAQIYRLDTTRSHATSDSLYKVLADRFPDSEFAPEAERLLGRPARTRETDPAQLSYDRAQGLLSDGDSAKARDTLRDIVTRYPSSSFAPKAQYALGWTYEYGSQRDSAISSYRRLVAQFPNSQYAPLVKPKLDEYDLYQKQLQQKAKDSLTSTTPDSLHLKKAPEQKMGNIKSVGIQDSLGLKKSEKDSLGEKPLLQTTPHDSTAVKNEKD